VQYFFHSPEYIAKLVDAFRLWGRKDREGAIRLARALRRSIIDPLLDALSDEQDASLRKFLLSVLVAIGSDVIPHVVRRLQDDRWYVLRNMIVIIRECNGRKELDKIRKYLKHDNINICMEVLKTLLHFRTPDSIPQLHACLKSKDPYVRQGAIKLAGIHRVRDAVPFLIRCLEKRDLFGTETYYKTGIVYALGEIGDTRAVGTLTKIFNAKTLFYRGDLEELKVAIFRSLENYPYESVRALVEQGLSSRNDDIYCLSEKYLAEYRAGDMKDV
jgi:HEAT repeat protein